jgi:hypothetical protein
MVIKSKNGKALQGELFGKCLERKKYLISFNLKKEFLFVAWKFIQIWHFLATLKIAANQGSNLLN